MSEVYSMHRGDFSGKHEGKRTIRRLTSKCGIILKASLENRNGRHQPDSYGSKYSRERRRAFVNMVMNLQVPKKRRIY
jgi:hypothetical protein